MLTSFVHMLEFTLHQSKPLENDMVINISKHDKAAVLATLYNNSRPQGMRFIQATPGDMTTDEAAALLEDTTYFDYLKGRVMKVDLSGDELNLWLYDRDLGEGAAQRAIDQITEGGAIATAPSTA